MLTPDERKSRLPYGAQQRAAEACGVVKSLVSNVVAGRARHEAVENFLVAAMNEAAREKAKQEGRARPEKLSRVSVFGPVMLSMRATRLLPRVVPAGLIE